jgi:hypothetical protein
MLLRWATIVVNFIVVVIALFFLLFGVGLFMMDKNNSSGVQNLEISPDDISVQMVFVSVILGMHAIGIYGALYYKAGAVMISANGYMIAIFTASESLNYFAAVLPILFLYPHFVFITGVQNEVMTPYNYERIKACCDC